MKKFIALIATMLLAVLCMVFVACTKEGENLTLEASACVYSRGEQTVELTIDKDGYTFEEDIAVSDVTVGNGLEGKEVTAVTYVDETTISVTLSGTVTAEVGNGIQGTITVGGGISDNATGTAEVDIYTPQMSVSGSTSSTLPTQSGVIYNFSSIFTLPDYGSFVKEYVTTDYITLPDDNGTITVSLTSDGNLKITVKGFTPTDDYAYPIVKIAAEVTTFNKELSVCVGENSLKGIVYDLV